MRSPLAMIKSILGLSDRFTRAFASPFFGSSVGTVFDSVWAIGGIEVVAQSIASLPLKFINSRTGLDIENPTREQSVLMRVLWNPDPMISTVQLFELTSMIYDIEGVCYWYLMNDEGGPIQNPLEAPARIMAFGPSKIKPRMTTPGSSIVQGWTLTDGADIKELRMFQVIRFWKTNPASYLHGLKITDKIGTTLELDKGAKEVNEGFFRRGARPSAVLQSGKDMDPDQLRLYGNQFAEAYASKENAGKIPVLPKSWTFTPFGDAKDMDFKNLYEVNRDEMFGGTRTPKHYMGVNDDINYATAEVMDRVFWLNAIRPKCVVFADVINSTLLLGSGMEVMFDFSGVPIIMIDELKVLDSKLKIAARMWRLGHSVNSINSRLSLNLPEIKDAWANQAHDPTLIGAQPQIDNETTKSVTRAVDPVDSKILDIVVKELESLKKKELSEAEVLQLAQDGDEEAQKTYAEIVMKETIDPIIPKMEKVIVSYFRRLEKSQLEKLRAFLDGDEYKTKSEPRELNEDNVNQVLFSEQKWNQILMTDTSPFHLQAYKAGIERVKKELDGFNVFVHSDEGAIIASSKVTPNIVGINKRLAENIRDSLIRAMQSGGGRAEFVEAVRSEFSTSVARANTIARTETGIAQSKARWDAMSVELETKQWLDSGDSHVRASHRDYSKLGAKPMDFEYNTNLKHPQQEGAEAAEVVNCRCVLVKGIKK